MKLAATTLLVTLLSVESADTYKLKTRTRNYEKRDLQMGGKGTTSCYQNIYGCVEANGVQEMPPLNTTLVSELDFAIMNSFSEFSYTMYLSGIVNTVFAAHLHCGAAGTNGPIALPIWPPITANTTMQNVTMDGVVVQTTITAADYSLYFNETGLPDCRDATGNSITVNNLVSLYTAMKMDLIYLNVHTFVNKPGEARGQVFLN